MGSVGHLLLFVRRKNFANISLVDKVIAMIRVAPFFDSQCRFIYRTAQLI